MEHGKGPIMISVNREAMKLVHEVIEKSGQLDIGISELSNGTTVIDMGLNYPGGFMAGKYFTEITMGCLGKVYFSKFPMKNIVLPSVEVFTDKPIISCICSQMSGWVLNKLKENQTPPPLISGPGRSLARKDSFIAPFPYFDKNSESVVAMQTNKIPDEILANEISKDCNISPKNLYILIAPTGSIVGSIQISARMLETCLWRLHTLGFDLNKIISSWGTAPISPVVEDEFKAMCRVNTAVYYGSCANFLVKSSDEEIEKIIDSIPLTPSTSNVYGTPFALLLDEAGGDLFKVEKSVHSVAEVYIINSISGKTYHAGKINYKILEETFLD